MKKEQKQNIVNDLAERIEAASHFYITDIEGLNAEGTSNLRRACFEKELQLLVVKNSLLKLALDKAEGEFEEIYETLKGNTSIIFTETGNVPAKLIKEFRKENEKPILKAAYVEESIYTGDDQLEALATIKSKDELIGDIVGLLQSPAKNVLSALQSGGSILSGVVKTLSERE